VDYWPTLPPVSQLPLAYRGWAWWLRNGPKSAGGTFGGSRLFAALKWLRRFSDPRTDYVTLSAPARPCLTISLTDFEGFIHALPVWYRGDVMLEVLQRLAAGSGTFIDIGANHGVYALGVAYLLGGPVVAVEPQPHLIEAIRRAATVSKLGNVRVVQSAAGARTGVATLNVKRSGSGTASVVRHGDDPGADPETVPISTLDDLCRDLAISHVQCIKMDVEGAEAEVIRGGAEVLRRDHPFIVFEDDPDSTTVPDLLRDLGYSAFHDVVSAMGGSPAGTKHAVCNMIAVPAGREGLFDQMVRG
jgi:FkbM family methyltransferase